MKINWGTAIVIAFGLFITFILFFVFRVQGNSKYDNELVVEEYYKHDARYDEEMIKVQNSANLPQKPTISLIDKGIEIVFPTEFIPESITGKVSFYRPSAKKLDFSLPLKLSGQTMLIPRTELAGGLWDTTISWQYDGKQYMMKKEIYLD